jgi:hypothetical protein
MTTKQQRRDQQRLAAQHREQERVERQRRVRRRNYTAGAALIVAVAGVFALVLSLNSASRKPSSPGEVSVVTQPFAPGTQVTLLRTRPPWSPPSDAGPFVAAAGLKVLGKEALAVHYHSHLDVIVNGTAVQVPAEVGFVLANRQAVGVTVLHTHDTSGIIHIESPVNAPYTLGQFFTEWGVQLARGELGGLTDGNGDTLRVYVDGREFGGDPASIVLQAHQEIALWYGSTSTKPQVPSSYQFPTGD